MKNNGLRKIGFGAGCFWCTEAIMKRFPSVITTEIGYGGGRYPDPDYVSVSADPCGHSELTVVTLERNDGVLYEILEFFFSIHDASKTYVINGNKGELYRSRILVDGKKDYAFAKAYVSHLKEINAGITTTVEYLKNYRRTEEKYQQYYDCNPEKSFSLHRIRPKLKKLGLSMNANL